MYFQKVLLKIEYYLNENILLQCVKKLLHKMIREIRQTYKRNNKHRKITVYQPQLSLA